MILAEQVAGTVDWWARGAGIAALAVAMGGLGWNVYNAVWLDRSRLKIETAITKLSREQQIDFAKMTSSVIGWLDCLGISVSNVGRRPVTVVQCTLTDTDGRGLFFMPGATLRYGQPGMIIDESHGNPKRLEEGESHKYYFPVESLAASLVEDPSFRLVNATVTDGTGKKWLVPIHHTAVEYIRRESKRSSESHLATQSQEDPVA